VLVLFALFGIAVLKTDCTHIFLSFLRNLKKNLTTIEGIGKEELDRLRAFAHRLRQRRLGFPTLAISNERGAEYSLGRRSFLVV